MKKVKNSFVILSFLLVSAMSSPAQIQYGAPTNLTSTSDGMISDRFQKHSFVTSDNVFHLMIRARTTAPALGLYSLTGNGYSFGLERAFKGSGSQSTSDMILINDNLNLVYDTQNGTIIFAHLAYSAGAWTVVQTSTVYIGATIGARPSVAMDSAGTIWVGFISQGVSTDAFYLYASSDGGATWVNSNAPLPTPAATSDRSLRVIAGATALYAVYSDQSAFGMLVSVWPGQWQNLGTFFTQAPPSQGMADPNGTHFSVTLDANSNLHFVTNDGAYHGVYMRYDLLGGAWTIPFVFASTTPQMRAAYMQIAGNKMGQLVGAFSCKDGTQNGVLVYRSFDNGDSWTQTSELLPNQNGTANARMETPELLTSNQPIFQQVLLSDGITQSIVGYVIP